MFVSWQLHAVTGTSPLSESRYFLINSFPHEVSLVFSTSKAIADDKLYGVQIIRFFFFSLKVRKRGGEKEKHAHNENEF